MDIATTPDLVRRTYARSRRNLEIVRRRMGRPLTLTEKVFFGHLVDPTGQLLERGKATLALAPDRVAMQDATAQMAILQFMMAGREETAVPTTVHCDHLLLAHRGAAADRPAALDANREVFEFLSSASARYGMGFWRPGSGIIHQVVLENYAFPGGLMIGTDSHTPNAGGLGMAACGVGGADAVDVMVGMPWEVLHPLVIGVRLVGAPSGWTAPKDVILKLCGLLTTKGGTNHVIEYFGPGCEAISCTGKATITNMGAELGATTSIFPCDRRMQDYLRATRRGELADLAAANLDLLRADPEVEADCERFFDRLVTIDLSTLEPHLVGPHSPDVLRPVSEMREACEREEFPVELKAALIGSCTNSSYEDINRAVDVARQALAHGLRMRAPLWVSPGSDQIYETIKRDGQLAVLEELGATVLTNACGPCIGQWKRDDIQDGERNSIVTSFNRNFRRRNDGNPETNAFMGSPEIVLAYGLAGRLDFNPLVDALPGADGRPVRLTPPAPADDLPPDGFVFADAGYQAPPADRRRLAVRVEPGSGRLALLEPFAPWRDSDFRGLDLLIKVKGKCTTDHISQAGPWLRFRGHLDRISDNLLLGGVNAFGGDAGTTRNPLDGKPGRVPAVARALKAAGRRWVIVGDENYGEGSSREHAAMSPRHLGCAAVIVRSFARIHETNLKKQGILPLVFADPADYDTVQETDTLDLEGLANLAPGSTVSLVLRHAGGGTDEVVLRHSLTAEQIGWLWAGSALNLIRQKR
ncbi:MAG TPA: aconitate hydratase [Candidatus Krumholzibacteria bacterium]|nr:aconitate hydratase [Candidatus Krumholzibacteria bacterium]HPD70853.1 aconitate hydratase [Candidatus Krumholzibacteria bacterium]HRY39447.1 aconitate hydratase [Candidatus Krumholzibacteria bacterium]